MAQKLIIVSSEQARGVSDIHIEDHIGSKKSRIVEVKLLDV